MVRIFGVLVVGVLSAAIRAEAIPLSIAFTGFTSYTITTSGQSFHNDYGRGTLFSGRLTLELPDPLPGSQADPDSEVYLDIFRSVEITVAGQPTATFSDLSQNRVIVINDWDGSQNLRTGDHVLMNVWLQSPLTTSLVSLEFEFVDPTGTRFDNDLIPTDLDVPFSIQAALLNLPGLGQVGMQITDVTIVATPEPSLLVWAALAGLLARTSRGRA